MADHGETGTIHHFKKLGKQRHDTKSHGDAPNVSCNSRGYGKDWDYLSMKSSACGCVYVATSVSPINTKCHI